jgi:hypothetical protein
LRRQDRRGDEKSFKIPDYIRCLYHRNFYCRGCSCSACSDSGELVVAAAFLSGLHDKTPWGLGWWNPRSGRLPITMDGSESDGKLETGNAVSEQANIPKVATSLWLVKLLMLLNVIRASPVASQCRIIRKTTAQAITHAKTISSLSARVEAIRPELSDFFVVTIFVLLQLRRVWGIGRFYAMG